MCSIVRNTGPPDAKVRRYMASFVSRSEVDCFPEGGNAFFATLWATDGSTSCGSCLVAIEAFGRYAAIIRKVNHPSTIASDKIADKK